MRIADGRPLSRGPRPIVRRFVAAGPPTIGRWSRRSSPIASCPFDTDSGVLRAEAGLSLDEIYRLFLPRGWFVPVTPNEVRDPGRHGRRRRARQEPSQGRLLRRARHRDQACGSRTAGSSPAARRSSGYSFLPATIGGMGLTGHIIQVGFKILVRIPSPWIWQESERMPNIEAFIAGLKATPCSRCVPWRGGRRALGVPDPHREVVTQLGGVARRQVDLVADAVERERDRRRQGSSCRCRRRGAPGPSLPWFSLQGFRPGFRGSVSMPERTLAAASPEGKANW